MDRMNYWNKCGKLQKLSFSVTVEESLTISVKKYSIVNVFKRTQFVFKEKSRLLKLRKTYVKLKL